MRYTGRLAGMSRDYKTGSPVVQMIVNEDPSPLDELREKELAIEIKEEKRKRSLDANAYYWVLVSKIADRLRESKSFIHNRMLRRYGQPQDYDGQIIYLVIAETERAQKQVDEDEYIHLKPTAEVKLGKDGRMYRTYILLKGSHEYDTREMTVLIDGVVSEAKGLSIETLTPDELARMKNAWGNG